MAKTRGVMHSDGSRWRDGDHVATLRANGHVCVGHGAPSMPCKPWLLAPGAGGHLHFKGTSATRQQEAPLQAPSRTRDPHPVAGYPYLMAESMWSFPGLGSQDLC